MTRADPPLIQTQPSPQALSLAALAGSVRFESLPPPVVAHAIAVVRDTLGAILAGSRLAEIQGLVRAAPTLGAGACTVIGARITAPAPVAAMINATAGVSLELDEGSQFALNHPAVHILPAVLAAAEDEDASGADLLAAFVAGYEIAVRVGRATRLRGPVHPFGTHSIVGAAVGVARLRGLDLVGAARAIELAAGLSIASSQAAANGGASVRNLATGLTSHNGLLAATLAEAGFGGEPGALESVFGRILGDAFDLEVEPALGEFLILKNYFKRHACSRWNHAPIEAMAQIMAVQAVDPQAVEAIVVHTFSPATRLSANTVVNGYAGKHSIPYNVAVRLLHADNGPDRYADAVAADPSLIALMARIRVEEDPVLTALVPAIRAARVEVTLASGVRLEATCERPPGGFDNPFEAGVLEAKFRRLAAEALDEPAVDALATAIAGLATAKDVTDLCRLLRPA